MKKSILLVFVAALTFTACNSDESILQEVSNNTITATMESNDLQSRVGFDKSSGALYWLNGDDIAVMNTGNSFTKYTLLSGEGTTTAKFTTVAQVGTVSTYALHPYGSHAYDGSALTFNLPNTYTYTKESVDYGLAPMMAEFETGKTNYYFQHLGGAFCFTMVNLPAGTTYVKFETDEQITGNFTVTENSETHMNEIVLPNEQPTSATGYSVTIEIPALSTAATKYFYIPVPVGTYNGFKISVGSAAAETWSYTSSASNTIVRKRLLMMPAITFGADVEGSVPTSISSSSDLAEAISNGGSYVLSSNISADTQLLVPTDKELTLDLSGNTLDLSETNGNARNVENEVVNGLINNGKLKIVNGTITFDKAFTSYDGITIDNRSSAIYNKDGAELELTNVNITSKTIAITIDGGWTNGTLQQQGNPTSKVTINGGSIATTGEQYGTFKPYAIYVSENCLLTVNNAVVSAEIQGAGNVAVDCGKAILNNVTMKATNPTGHNLYLMGAAEVTATNCNMTSASGSKINVYANTNWGLGDIIYNGSKITYPNLSSTPVITTPEEVTTAFTNGGTYAVAGDVEANGLLTVAKGKTLNLYLGKENTLNLSELDTYHGIKSQGALNIYNGKITYDKAFTSEDGIAVGNRTSAIFNDNGVLTLNNVNVTSATFAVTIDGPWDNAKTLQNQGNTDVKVTITGGSIATTGEQSGTFKPYAIYACENCLLTMNGTSVATNVEGAGNIVVDCAKANLTNVTMNATNPSGHNMYLVGAAEVTTTNCTMTSESAKVVAYGTSTWGLGSINYNNTLYTLPDTAGWVTIVQ